LQHRQDCNACWPYIDYNGCGHQILQSWDGWLGRVPLSSFLLPPLVLGIS
jgi:hypothetical protein